ncbi:MAG TPA: hypothetical protein VN247_07185 [Arenimonas sp.]|nr:hypothetical protein [Arenimonas sp.]
MSKFNKAVLFGISFAVLMCVDYNPQTTLKINLIPEASAIVGRPLTPVSYAGVARRSTYRAVAATEATVAANTNAAAQANASAQASAAAAAEANAAAQASANAAAQTNANAAAGVLEVGTIVTALPAGCNTSKVVNNSSYYDCGGVYYKAGYQSGNLVYVVSAP